VTVVDSELLSLSFGSSTCASRGAELGITALEPLFGADNICVSGILGTCPLLELPVSDALTTLRSAPVLSGKYVEGVMNEEKEQTLGGYSEIVNELYTADLEHDEQSARG
jgi:hypothetical protein